MYIVSKNILSLGVSKVIGGVVMFLVYTRLVTYLGPQRFGQYSIVFAYFIICQLLIDLGTSRYVVKKISEDKSTASRYLGNFILVQVITSALIFLVFLAIPKILHYDATVSRAMTLAAFGLFLLSFSIPFSSIIQAWQRIHVLSFVIILNSLINAIWLALTVFLQRDVVFIFVVYLIIGVVNLLIFAKTAAKLVLPNFQIRKDLIKKMLLYGLPFALISGFEILISKVDSVIQKQFLPYHQVGIYSTAYRFLDFLAFLPAIVSISLFPYLAERPNLHDGETTATLNRLNRFMVILGIPLGLGVTLLARKIILTLFKSSYAESILPFQILIWATVLTLIYAVPNVIMITKKTKQTVIILAIVTAINIFGNIFLIPRFGILASAWLTVASYLTVGVIYIYYSLKEATFSLFRYLPWPVIASAGMGVALYFSRGLNLFLEIPLAVLVYFFVLRLSGFLNRRDWDFVKSLLGFKKI